MANYSPYAVPQAPPPKKTWRVVLIVVGAVLVLCCGGLGVGGYFLFKGVKEATGPALDAANQFVVNLEHGDTDAAYEQLCAGTRTAYTKDAFADGVAKQPKITAHKTTGVNVASINGRTTATATMTLTLDSGFSEQHAFPMLKESGDWKICGRPY
ncbi:hypothetical protein [Dactylosporangium salmoneum]|uniref:DUF4878 domain-containing protein n=1 Tax=Dactylosporangium salmoneum TaxID=53361 RepID=A0ABP5TPQ5_9ACTN